MRVQLTANSRRNQLPGPVLSKSGCWSPVQPFISCKPGNFHLRRPLSLYAA